MTTETRRMTYEEYLEGPEIKGRYDIVDGVLKMAPSPTRKHQEILGQLYHLLRNFLDETRLGSAFIAPLDVVIEREPLKIRQPDLLFVSNERAEILHDIVEGAPDLVVEILSPSNSRADIQEKLDDYAGLGVSECWLVSPEGRTVEVLTAAESGG
ncbi:MAG: Uma2 family endonuclease, partial [Chloroflexi bacterium]|nr:Uma2 family endonuclease [Chloroflexota bacterium]